MSHTFDPFQCWPLSILTKQQKSLLQQKERPLFSFEKGQTIPSHFALFFLAKGIIELHKKEGPDSRFHYNITAGTFIGLRESLLHIPQEAQLICHTPVLIECWDVSSFIEMITETPHFAQAVSRALKNKFPLFGSINQFTATLQQEKKSGQIRIEHMLEVYEAMSPALHPHIKEAQKIDFGAWSYARNRLPQDILTTHVYLIATETPSLLAPISQHLQGVKTKYRRRNIKKINPGKSLVLVRDMHTDLIDFVSNLCIHSIEAQKLRRLLHQHNILEKLYSPQEEIEILLQNKLGENWRIFQSLWPQKTIEALRSLALHHEDYILYVEEHEQQYFEDSTERWIRNIQEQCHQQNIDMENVVVDIISSNRFVMHNCLSPHIHRHADAIYTWGQKQHHLDPTLFSHKIDYVYAILDDYLHAFPEQRKFFDQPFSGFQTCNQKSSTGMPVDIIHLKNLDKNHIDPCLSIVSACHPHHIIINIDYAFGKQAESIMSALISLFHKQIKSINIMGKAGALVGNRGDILLSKQVVLANREVAYPMRSSRIHPSNPFLKNVHEGSVLTVEGTLLQNKPLLHYFLHFWSCVGLEMEGSFYARQIQRSLHQGVLRKDVESNFLYFVSDLPMQEGAQLSKDMGAHESIPQIYGILRSFLNNIFSREL